MRRASEVVASGCAAASAVGVGVILYLDDNNKLVRSSELSDADIVAASGVRELEAVRRTLELMKAEGMTTTTEPLDLDISSDATVAAHTVTRGSARATDMVAKLKQIAELFLEFADLVIRITWRPREENKEADAASRALGSEATLPRGMVESLMTWATGAAGPRAPEVDLFATADNSHSRTFFSRVPDARAWGADGLQPWPWPTRRRTWYGFPPFSLAERAFQLWEQLRALKLDGVMVLPYRRVAHLLPRTAFFDGYACLLDSKNVIPPPGARPGWTCGENLVAIRT